LVFRSVISDQRRGAVAGCALLIGVNVSLAAAGVDQRLEVCVVTLMRQLWQVERSVRCLVNNQLDRT
jgi:hypothetical protein